MISTGSTPSIGTVLCLYQGGQLRSADSNGRDGQSASHIQWHVQLSDSSLGNHIVGGSSTDTVVGGEQPSPTVAFDIGVLFVRTHQSHDAQQGPLFVHLSVNRITKGSWRTEHGCACMSQTVRNDGSLVDDCGTKWCDVAGDCPSARPGKAGGHAYNGWDYCANHLESSLLRPLPPPESIYVEWGATVLLKSNGQKQTCANQLRYPNGDDACLAMMKAWACTQNSDGALESRQCDNVDSICHSPAAVFLMVMGQRFDLTNIRIRNLPHEFGHLCPQACDMCNCRLENNGQCNAGVECAVGTDVADCFCRYEDDNVCDQANYCTFGSDKSDCSCEFQDDGICDEGQTCPLGSDTIDCCPTARNGVCDEGRLCPHGSDRADCFCPSTSDGVCNEVTSAPNIAAKRKSCPLRSDTFDCIANANSKFCPAVYTTNGQCDAGAQCPCGTDAAECGPSESVLQSRCSTSGGAKYCSSDTDCGFGEYCAHFSYYSYATLCRPCSFYQHICADFADAVAVNTIDGAEDNREQNCATCETYSWAPYKLPLWQLRLYDPSGHGWGTNQWTLESCQWIEASFECVKANEVASGSPVSVPHVSQSGLKVATTEFTRNICRDWLRSNPHNGEAPQEECYRLTVMEPKDDSVLAAVKSQVSWDLLTNGNPIASGGFGKFLVGKGCSKDPAGTPCGPSESLLTVLVWPTQRRGGYVSAFSRRALERWTLVTENTSYVFPLCTTTEVLGADSCVRIPRSGVVKYSLCIPRAHTYMFTYFAFRQSPTGITWPLAGWNLTVAGHLLETSHDMVGNNSAMGNGVRRSHSFAIETDGRVCDERCRTLHQTSVPAALSARKAAKLCPSFLNHGNPVIDCAGQCALVEKFSNGRCDPNFNCVEWAFDGSDCDLQVASGWAVTTGDTFNGRLDPWLSLSESGHEQLVVDVRGHIYTKGSNRGVYTHDQQDKANTRVRTFSCSLPQPLAPNDACVDFKQLTNGWFCCSTSQHNLAFWHSNRLLMQISRKGRLWGAAAGGFFDSDKQHRYNYSSSLLFRNCATGSTILQVGPWAMCEPGDDDYATVTKLPMPTTTTLAIFWAGQLKLVVTDSGHVWTSHSQSFLQTIAINDTARLDTDRDELDSNNMVLAVSGEYNLWVDDDFVSSGVATVAQEHTLRFDASCEQDLLIALQVTCKPDSKTRCGIRLEAEWCGQRIASSNQPWVCSAKFEDCTGSNLHSCDNAPWSRAYDDSSFPQPTVIANDSSISTSPTTDVFDLLSASEWIWAADVSHDDDTTQSILCRARWRHRGSTPPPVGRTSPPSTIGLGLGLCSSIWCVAAIWILSMIALAACACACLHRVRLHFKRRLGVFDADSQAYPIDPSRVGSLQSNDAYADAARAIVFASLSADPVALASGLDHSDLSELRIKNAIGRGPKSIVYAAEWGGKEVAIKNLNLPDAVDANANEILKAELTEFVAEIRVMSKLRHPNIIDYVGFSTTPRCLIVQELAPNGDLRSYLEGLRTRRLREREPSVRDTELLPGIVQQLTMALDIARGMAYLHGRDPIVLHRDLKSPNLLLCCDQRIKITDFGLSREKCVLADETAIMTVCGTPLWTAPEILRGQVYNESADVYSFAMCLWEIWGLTLPHAELQLGPMEVALKVLADQARPSVPPDMPPFFAGLLRECWDEDGSSRPSFVEVVEAIESFAAQLVGTVTLPPLWDTDRTGLSRSGPAGGAINDELHSTDHTTYQESPMNQRQ